MVALMVGTHCWNATLQQEVATVLAPVRKGPARPPAPATPAARDVGTGPQPSHSASPAGAHTVSPAPRATTARQREFTPPARLHSLAVSPPREIPASAVSAQAARRRLSAARKNGLSRPRVAVGRRRRPPRRRSRRPPPIGGARQPTRRVVSAQQRRSKARMGDRGCRVGIWWPRGEPTKNPAEAHQQRIRAAARARRRAARRCCRLCARQPLDGQARAGPRRRRRRRRRRDGYGLGRATERARRRGMARRWGGMTLTGGGGAAATARRRSPRHGCARRLPLA